MNTLFTSTASVIMVITIMIATALYLQKIKVIKNYLGPAMTVIILGIILSNTHVMPFWTDSYGIIMTYGVPLFISIMLLSVDVKEMAHLSRKALLAMAIAVFSVSIVTVIAGLIFSGKIDEGWKIAGMYVGTYTGGSANLSAIAVALGAEASTIAAANAADYVVGMPLTIVLFAMPAILKASKKFNKLWPYSLSEEELTAGRNNEELMTRKEWGIGDIATMLAYGLIVTGVATFLAGLVPEYFGVVRILTVTTIAIIVAQTPFAKKIKGNMDLGMYISLAFLCVIGISVNIKEFAGSALAITGFCAVVILGTLALHVIITRLFKIEYQYVLISITSAIADGSTSAMIAAGGGWKSLISIAVVLGVLGMVIGNYLGVGIAYLIKALLGM